MKKLSCPMCAGEFQRGYGMQTYSCTGCKAVLTPRISLSENLDSRDGEQTGHPALFHVFPNASSHWEARLMPRRVEHVTTGLDGNLFFIKQSDEGIRTIQAQTIPDDDIGEFRLKKSVCADNCGEFFLELLKGDVIELGYKIEDRHFKVIHLQVLSTEEVNRKRLGGVK